jgi:D-tyrosyl-tRNA(Tyr) deacylase
MRAVIQRVKRAAVQIGGETVGSIGPGMLILLGITHGDKAADAQWLAEKIVGLRIFEDAQGKMNRDLTEVGGKLLVVSQFTLYGDCQKGRRPSFVAAARPEEAIPLYEEFLAAARRLGVEVQTGQFGAEMQVELINDGPVTLLLEREPTNGGGTA